MAILSSQQTPYGTRSSFMARLRRDVRGNTMILTAAATLPIMGLIGGGIDIARAYASKTRLQNACDSGALAARRAMTGATPSSTDLAEGNKFFDFNFNNGLFGIAAAKVTRKFEAGATSGTIKGTASVDMDYTIMKIFGETKINLAVACTATVNIPNTDIMFVLDTTGSMSSKAVSTDTVSKIDGLKTAVKDFYRELGPGTTTGAGRIRYGMMPYSHTVNVGSVLPLSSFIGNVTGETINTPSRTPITELRHINTGYTADSVASTETFSDGSYSSWGSWNNLSAGTSTINGVSVTTPYTANGSNGNAATCSAALPANHVVTGTKGSFALSNTTADPAYPATLVTMTYQATQTLTDNKYQWFLSNPIAAVKNKSGVVTTQAKATCTAQKATRTATRTYSYNKTKDVIWADRTYLTGWDYGLKNVDISGVVKTGTQTNPAYWSGFSDLTSPNGSGLVGATATLSWGGCIEERPSVNTITGSTTGLDIPSNAYDMQIDLAPSASDANTRWKPYLPGLQYYSLGSTLYWWGGDPATLGDYSKCPAAATKLTKYTGDLDSSGLSSSFGTEVDKLTPSGFTLHDIGMVWGARFLSPTGMFAADNADSAAPGGFQVSRHLVFMTDGMMSTPNSLNSGWGVNTLTGQVSPTSTDATNLMAAHEKRLAMLCNAAKSKGFTIWVVAFATGSVPTSLQNCATDSDHWSLASNSATLKQKFKDIAETIGGLRLSQ
jgi:Flp pilus assembly protein TadG